MGLYCCAPCRCRDLVLTIWFSCLTRRRALTIARKRFMARWLVIAYFCFIKFDTTHTCRALILLCLPQCSQILSYEFATNSDLACVLSQLTTNNVDTMRRTVDGLTLDMQNIKKEQLDMSIRVRRVQVAVLTRGSPMFTVAREYTP